MISIDEHYRIKVLVLTGTFILKSVEWSRTSYLHNIIKAKRTLTPSVSEGPLMKDNVWFISREPDRERGGYLANVCELHGCYCVFR